jgi:dienelactone hydrolase
MKLATLLLDLLTHAEEVPEQESLSWPPDIELLAQRLVGATDWLSQNPLTESLSIGYCGENTGAAAALVAAAERPATIGAIVTRGGQLDLAGEAVAQVQAPTLLIVGGEDLPALASNQKVMSQLKAEKRLEIVRGASHHFQEPGALEKAARSASRWFESYLVSPQLSQLSASKS